eukprot:CAMPEP_0174993692 /NCGR_PEP_ID=MMETSP0004_2-20121128/23216_1 /TAXON_ID=420556 /ORGANISM="Ochromonas sp., Strain CCMP1393" /LENGTH=288 /DNA_ID=CAMNT_0016247835 /DNA_START=130 /DNA_END=997 /DNA_ORIENTATION=+
MSRKRIRSSGKLDVSQEKELLPRPRPANLDTVSQSEDSVLQHRGRKNQIDPFTLLEISVSRTKSENFTSHEKLIILLLYNLNGNAAAQTRRDPWRIRSICRRHKREHRGPNDNILQEDVVIIILDINILKISTQVLLLITVRALHRPPNSFVYEPKSDGQLCDELGNLALTSAAVSPPDSIDATGQSKIRVTAATITTANLVTATATKYTGGSRVSQSVFSRHQLNKTIIPTITTTIQPAAVGAHSSAQRMTMLMKTKQPETHPVSGQNYDKISNNDTSADGSAWWWP